MTEFGGVDFFIDRCADTDEIRNAIANAFRLRHKEVDVVEDITCSAAEASWVCVARRVEGEFCWVVAIHCAPVAMNDDFIDLAMQQIADNLECRCLFPDAELNPYTWRLFAPRAAPRAAWLNTDEYDEDRIVISKIFEQ